ncbi:MAG: VIT family protein [Acidimicrobiales bacterium]|nr:VIT family protein [Hyphomonadaceae bacterium]RZV36410.1 MAG: VIT family protein [Acidimicrobiales bacterium]
MSETHNPLDDHHHHHEDHLVHRIGWLRAAVLGANDGIVSTASLLVGIAAASAGKPAIVVAGFAALVAGAMSMAAGEYISVSSQADTEKADLEKEAQALKETPEAELYELAEIYEQRGVDKKTAMEVAKQLTAHDALGTHARDELGISETVSAQPVQAAFSSAVAFTVGAALPLMAAVLAPLQHITLFVGITALASLALLGVVSARAGGASVLRSVVRVFFWGTLAMVITGLAGAAFGGLA